MKILQRSYLLGLVVLAGFASTAQAEGALPFGPFTDHLNFVFAASNEADVNRFYGNVLGLKRVADIDLPGPANMVRYMGGKSEIKFIVNGRELPNRAGSTREARGIRLLAFMLPASEKDGIVARMKDHDIAVPAFTQGKSDAGYSYEWGITTDFDGNAIEVVFLDENAPIEKLDEVQIGLAVSDLAKAETFLREVMGYSAEGTTVLASGAKLNRYGLGASQVKCWEVPADLPAHVAGPMEQVGMCLVQAIVMDVEKARAEIIERGGVIAQEPFPLGKLATIMFVEGPDGILFEIVGPLLDRFK